MFEYIKRILHGRLEKISLPVLVEKHFLSTRGEILYLDPSDHVMLYLLYIKHQ